MNTNHAHPAVVSALSRSAAEDTSPLGPARRLAEAQAEVPCAHCGEIGQEHATFGRRRCRKFVGAIVVGQPMIRCSCPGYEPKA